VGVAVIQEMWSNIPSYVGYYQVSTHGNVRSVDRIVYTVNGGKNPHPGQKIARGRVIKAHDLGKGYLYVNLSMNGHQKMIAVHRLMAEAFISIELNGLTVNHKDGNKQNNTLENIELVSIQENIAHAFKTGLRDQQGEKNKRSKLSEAQVLGIRQRYLGGESLSKLSNEFSVGGPCIWKIVSRRTWKHLSL
jgi:hypothetical protein